MARRDLQDLREQLIDTFYLTRAEIGAMKYWSEEKLLEALALFEAVAEADAEFEADEPDTEAEPYDFPGSDDDFYDDYDDGYYWYEYEVVIDYGND